MLNDLLTSPLNSPVIDPEINESRMREVNEAVVQEVNEAVTGDVSESRVQNVNKAAGERSERLLKGSAELEARRQQALKEIAEVGGMMAAKKKAGKSGSSGELRFKHFRTTLFFLRPDLRRQSGSSRHIQVMPS